jgi:hypothetical protein
MKYLKYALYTFCLAIALMSCGEVNEEIKINKNGKGNYHVHCNVIPGIKDQMESMMGYTGKELDNVAWQNFPETVDSTFDITSQLPEDVKNDPKKLEIAQKLKMYMKGSRATDKMVIGMQINFDSVQEIHAVNNIAQSSQQQAAGGLASASQQYTLISKGGITTFNRSENNKVDTKDMSTKDKMLMKKMMGDGTWITTITSDDKIKSAKGDNLVAVTSNKVVFKHNLKDIVSGKKNLSFTLEFE